MVEVVVVVVVVVEVVVVVVVDGSSIVTSVYSSLKANPISHVIFTTCPIVLVASLYIAVALVGT